MKKRCFLIAAAVSLFVSGTAFAESGWVNQDGGWYWYGTDGSLAVNTVMEIDGAIYEMDENGLCKKLENYQGWVTDGSNWWLVKEDNTRYISQWAEIFGDWYYFDQQGFVSFGWITDQGNQYYLDGQGRMVHDQVLEIGGVPYIFDSQGVGKIKVKDPVAVAQDSEKSDLQKELDAMADQILSVVVNDSMSQRDKAVAIYQWIRGNITYKNQEIGTDWVFSAYDGLRRRRGDCYTFYAISVELLSRVGIPSIEVIRDTDNNHYWNLVQIDGSWYHFDSTPRYDNAVFCLWTDGQMEAYSAPRNNCRHFDRRLYPATP